MFKFKNKNTSAESTAEPVKKKKLKWILIAAAVILLLIIVGLGDGEEKIPTLADNMSDRVELYSEEKADGVTKRWYKIDPEDLSLVEDYVDLLCDEHGFETVDGKDNDYYLYCEKETDIGVLYTDNGENEYHLRIGIPDEGEDQSIIAFIYVDGLFAEEEADKDDTTEKDADEQASEEQSEGTSEETSEGTTIKSTEANKKPGKDEVLVTGLKTNVTGGRKPGKSSVQFQSMFDYFPQGFTFKEPEQSGLSYVQKFKASEDDEDAVEEYINFLCSGGMNFKLADKHYEDFRGQSTANSKKVFAAWALNYTGTASVEQKCSTAFIDGEKYALTVYYTIEYGKIEGVLEWSVSLESTDLGFRAGGKIVNVAPGGKSVSTGLIRKADGTYETSDGRFSASLNEAVIIKNGRMQKGTLEYEDNSPKGGDCLRIFDSNAKKLMCVVFPKSGIQKTGMLLGYNALLQEYQFPLSGDPYGDLGEDTEIYQYIGTKWLTATYSDSPCKDMTFRVVYYNKAEKVAVYYIYAHFTEETEALCVVDLSKATKYDQYNSSGIGSGSGVPSLNNGSRVCAVCKNKGKTFCNRCNGTGEIIIRGSIAGFGSGYNGSFTENKGDCPECTNGYKRCPYCN